MIIEELKKLYITHTGHEPEAIDELPSSGSNRRYFRLKGTPTLIGVSGESVEENRAFLYMAEHFRGKGLPVPEVFIRSEDNIYYLQEDLGDTLLFNAIEKGRKTSVFDEEEKQLLRKTMRLLPAVQFAGADGMDYWNVSARDALVRLAGAYEGVLTVEPADLWSEYALQRALASLPNELAGRFVCLPEGSGARFVLSNPTYACFSGFSPDADMAECVTLSAYGHPIMILYERTAKEADRP